MKEYESFDLIYSDGGKFQILHFPHKPHPIEFLPTTHMRYLQSTMYSKILILIRRKENNREMKFRESLIVIICVCLGNALIFVLFVQQRALCPDYHPGTGTLLTIHPSLRVRKYQLGQ